MTTKAMTTDATLAGDDLFARTMDLGEIGFYAAGAKRPGLFVVFADACCIDMDVRRTKSGAIALDLPRTWANKRLMETLSARACRGGLSLSSTLAMLRRETDAEIAACRADGTSVRQGFRQADRTTPDGHQGFLAMIGPLVAGMDAELEGMEA